MKKKIPLQFHWYIEKTKTGYSVYEEKLSIYTTAKNMPELLNHCYESAALFYDVEEDDIQRKQHHFHWDWKSFLNEYRILNAQLLAKRIGIHPTLLSQYLNGTKIPSLRQQQKITEGIRRIGKELSHLSFGFE
jgi:hypothetical protein